MDSKIVSKILLASAFALAACGFTVSASAQWLWIDKDGHKVFSDRSPPADIKDSNILKRPAGSMRVAAPVEGAQTPASAATGSAAPLLKPGSAPKVTGKDAQLEAKKKEAADAEAAKARETEEKNAVIKAENCSRAKANLATLQSGIRVAAVNSKGEREVYDDARIAAETKRAQASISSSCS